MEKIIYHANGADDQDAEIVERMSPMDIVQFQMNVINNSFDHEQPY